MPELWFHDLIPPERPASSLFEVMWNQALASVEPDRLNFNGPRPALPPTEGESRPQTPSESTAQPSKAPQDERAPQSRDTLASVPIDTTDDAATMSPAEDSQAAQPESAQPPEEELPDQPSDSPSEKPAVQTASVSPSENNEVRFDDLIPDQSEPLYRPIVSPVQEADKKAEKDPPSQAAMATRSPGLPLAGPTTGIGRQSLPPKAGPPVPRLSKAPLLRTTALDLLLSTILPTPLNEGDAEYIASVFPLPYGKLKGTLPSGFQANHLNQSGAYRKVIPHDEGLAVGMYGNVLTNPGTTHYVFHESSEVFWDRYRDNGDLYGTRPTNSDYDQALRRALEAVGYPPEEVT